MFTEPDKLHITIGVMCLMDDVDRSAAVALLNDMRETLIVWVHTRANEKSFENVNSNVWFDFCFQAN